MSLEIRLTHRFGSDGFGLDVAFEAPSGVTALFGRSGAGKTTIANAVAGLLSPDAGRIVVAGETLLDTSAGVNAPRHRRRIGYVFQEGRLFPHLSVRGNLEFGRRFAPKDAPLVDVERIVAMLGIDGLLDRRPRALSGGEKQRVAIGRALISSPRALVLDEPLAALDTPRKAEILPYLERLRDETAIPILYVSHALSEVARLATTVVALSDGRVARAGPAAEVLSDPTAFPLLGRQEAGAIFTARVVAHDPSDGLSALDGAGGRLWTPLIDAPVGAALRVRIRARDVLISDRPPEGLSALNVLAARVESVGDVESGIVEVALACGDARLLARLTRRSLDRLGLSVGAPCFAVVKSIALGRRDLGRLDDAAD